MCNIPEDAILHSHRRENLKSYIPVEFPESHQRPNLTTTPHTTAHAMKLAETGRRIVPLFAVSFAKRIAAVCG
jgi:hypothetical protein